jgi:endogenous inhibitor of DNA gyrase (YacG/DUF329 family)
MTTDDKPIIKCPVCAVLFEGDPPWYRESHRKKFCSARCGHVFNARKARDAKRGLTT